MSSHVVVLDVTARRATVKTSLGKHLTDILQEACTKLGIDASQYGLKYKGKQLDLSIPFRLAGLASGAKLELVQLSRSPSVVTVGLQLPESEARGIPNGRLTDKFPSTTTLWLVLRKFEAGVAGNGSSRNLTARGVPATGGGSGAGRLFYEIPVIQALGRELSTFTDLQKSLAQLGFNSGSILLRLSFRRTEEPLEEAMVKIGDYFKSVDDATPKVEEQPGAEQMDEGGNKQPAEPPTAAPETAPTAPITSEESSEAPTPHVPSDEPSSASHPSSHPVTVFSPPSSSTPLSAQTAYNENDYILSVEHARAYQHRLKETSRPNRLLSDAEIANKEAAEREKLAGIKEVDVKIRLPDQSQVVSKFGQEATGKTLYDFVRSCMAEPFSREKFAITFFPSPGGPAFGAKKMQNVVPDSDTVYLIKNLGMMGRVLVNFTWDPSASPAAHQSRASVLKPELQSRAQQHKVEQPRDIVEEPAVPGSGGPAQGEREKPARKPGSLPKWLKLPGKK
ncbi:UBX domain protein [Aspergillus sclerotialis]|uniref:UBX domain protein n=1 Tax=Aspergillus sclerotialis TaxID=2070753 RepID=A0A3A3A5U6_9EURO|nr:UBX domain protein [Aspergillus sclerotialis]